MTLSSIKRTANRLLGLVGFEIQRSHPRSTLLGALRQARRAGLAPRTVLDIGAAQGWFTRECRAIFPEAHYLLVEPLDEFQPALVTLAQDPRITVIQAAAAGQTGAAVLNVHADLVGSSLLLEQEDSDVNGTPRAVNTVAVDQVVAELKLDGPYLLKLDVQGAELPVLAGAQRVLQAADYVVLEVSLFRFFRAGHVFSEVVQYMDGLGFAAYDLLGWRYRPLDEALSQIDLAFVQKNGPLWRSHFYATREQREASAPAAQRRR